jgi:hypothetical protein
MFSLIITIIAIALVAALALATIYYGGAAFNVSSSRTHATSLINQGEQIIAAAKLYYLDNGHAVSSLSTLVAEGYLSSIPVPAPGIMKVANEFSLIGNAYADTNQWTWDASTQTLALVKEVGSADICQQVNAVSYNGTTILNVVDTSVRVQCYGPGQPYTVMWSAAMDSATVDGKAALCAAADHFGEVPTDCAPGLATGGSGGGSSSGSGTSSDPSPSPVLRAPSNTAWLSVAQVEINTCWTQNVSVPYVPYLTTLVDYVPDASWLTQYNDLYIIDENNNKVGACGQPAQPDTTLPVWSGSGYNRPSGVNVLMETFYVTRCYVKPDTPAGTYRAQYLVPNANYYPEIDHASNGYYKVNITASCLIPTFVYPPAPPIFAH